MISKQHWNGCHDWEGQTDGRPKKSRISERPKNAGNRILEGISLKRTNEFLPLITTNTDKFLHEFKTQVLFSIKSTALLE